MAASRSKKNSDGWKQREQLVALIEKCISPDARVEHDVRLPVIGRARTRQCDVVIRYGYPPRESFAIVEIQKRNRKPDITTFHGWVRKMEEVGAGQLFCVSAQGYPDSVIDDVATRLGPRVKLLTLGNLTESTELSGFVLVPNLIELCPGFAIQAVDLVDLSGRTDEREITVSTDDAVFSVGDSQVRLSLNDIVSRALHNSADIKLPEPHLTAGWSQSVELVFDDSCDLVLHYGGGGKAQVARLPVSVLIACALRSTPISVHSLSYRQVDVEGTLAWTTTARLEHQGQEVELTLIYSRDEQGYLRLLPAPVNVIAGNQIKG